MTRPVRLYCLLLALLLPAWLLWHWQPVRDLIRSDAMPLLLAVCALYGAAHLSRMLRLALLTLDQRDKAAALATAHALTAFPSSLLPFKIGEILRLAALFHVYDNRRKALAVWLAERFGDVLVIAALILGLYLLQVEVPPAMQLVFVLFVVVSAFGLMALFAVAKTFVYLNRHLVLSSHSPRGLALLRASHALRQLELDIYRSVEGRLAGFLLVSVLIWVLEIAALALFIQLVSTSWSGFGALFASGVMASLAGSASAAFGLYRSLALIALTALFLAGLALAARIRHTRS
ncbi:hypothetical protein GJ697_27440 [Pseudoduganella sp. FT25W]|uniref:Flippase-like domain-containing protein n=1 Tax=Duganella alba TaxID=2666081 RepID=A0A6L5QNY0_9BURK|nr:lysylphosphatidylglycerol synthase domain-containing protein [Duganella alba]MRX11566.1 hypothetical protein [Duganella alba]MRX20023.1 hypothetical protein [Duganella alba]